MKISHKSIVELSQLSPQNIRRLGKQISSNTVDFVVYSDIRKVLPKRQDSKRQLTPVIPAGSIKDMPAYDPDAEISSNARYKLEKELLGLKETIDTMLAAIRGGNLMDDYSVFIPKVHFEQIPIKNLVSNQEYQRNLSLSHVHRTVQNFDLYQINPVKVSRRDGINYVFNG